MVRYIYKNKNNCNNLLNRRISLSIQYNQLAIWLFKAAMSFRLFVMLTQSFSMIGILAIIKITTRALTPIRCWIMYLIGSVILLKIMNSNCKDSRTSNVL